MRIGTAKKIGALVTAGVLAGSATVLGADTEQKPPQQLRKSGPTKRVMSRGNPSPLLPKPKGAGK